MLSEEPSPVCCPRSLSFRTISGFSAGERRGRVCVLERYLCKAEETEPGQDTGGDFFLVMHKDPGQEEEWVWEGGCHVSLGHLRKCQAVGFRALRLRDEQEL